VALVLNSFDIDEMSLLASHYAREPNVRESIRFGLIRSGMGEIGKWKPWLEHKSAAVRLLALQRTIRELMVVAGQYSGGDSADACARKK
jgi:hypothetical protein